MAQVMPEYVGSAGAGSQCQPVEGGCVLTLDSLPPEPSQLSPALGI